MKKLIVLVLGLLLSYGGISQTTAPAQAKAGTEKARKAEGPKLKADGTPDKRYKENKHLKKDGTPDRRFKEHKDKKD